MAQIAPPNADIATGHWSPTPLYKQINARTVNLADPSYVGTSLLAGDSFAVGLRGIAYPDPNGPQTLFVRARNTSGIGVPMTVFLLENGVIIACQRGAVHLLPGRRPQRRAA